ncbi:MAG: hypothetical protein J6330_02605 [Clostridia bacterium]|nr:hypothetical protein [Clostridia bacterium]
MKKFYGKEKCRILKKVRAQIAKNNDIEWVTNECPHKGDCRGTCPKCEAEVRELERKLEDRRRAGLTVALAGVAAGVALTVTGCANPPSSTAQGGQTTDNSGTVINETDAPEMTAEEKGEILEDGSKLSITEECVIMGDMIIEDETETETETGEDEQFLMGKIAAPETEKLIETEEEVLMGEPALPENVPEQ